MMRREDVECWTIACRGAQRGNVAFLVHSRFAVDNVRKLGCGDPGLLGLGRDVLYGRMGYVCMSDST